jgi:hypothetical protein
VAHTYELSDDLVLTVLAAIHQNFPDYRIYAVNSSDLLIVAVAEGRLPAPDWKTFELAEVKKDLCHFYPIRPRDLEALLLTTRPALAPLLDGVTEINSDFYPVLDLGAERARFLRQSASTINSLYQGLYDWSGPGSSQLIPDGRLESGIGTSAAALLPAGGQAGRAPGRHDRSQWQISPTANNEASTDGRRDR